MMHKVIEARLFFLPYFGKVFHGYHKEMSRKETANDLYTIFIAFSLIIFYYFLIN